MNRVAWAVWGQRASPATLRFFLEGRTSSRLQHQLEVEAVLEEWREGEITTAEAIHLLDIQEPDPCPRSR